MPPWSWTDKAHPGFRYFQNILEEGESSKVIHRPGTWDVTEGRGGGGESSRPISAIISNYEPPRSLSGLKLKVLVDEAVSEQWRVYLCLVERIPRLLRRLRLNDTWVRPFSCASLNLSWKVTYFIRTGIYEDVTFIYVIYNWGPFGSYPIA